MKAKKIIFTLGIFIFFVLGANLTSASSVSVWQGQYYTGTTFNTGTYTFNFTVYDALTGGTACFTNTTSLTTGSWGQWSTEQSPWATCNNASKDYFLNINIAGTDETPRRRLTVSDFLRRDVEEVKSGSLVVSDNMTADYYFGDGQYLTGINGSGDINSVQGDGIYLYNGSDSGNVVLAFNESRLNDTISLNSGSLNVNSSTYSNSTSWWSGVMSWVSGWFVNNGGALEFNETRLNNTIDARASGTTYSHLSNFTDDLGNRGYTSLTNFTNNLGIGNWTLDKTNYFTSAQVLSFNYYNSTDFSIGDYYLNSNPFGYYNSTTLPASTETDPYWTGNFTLYNSSWSSTYNSTYNTWAYNQTTPAINKILSFNYYNSTDFDIGDYYLNSNPFGYYNSTTLPSSTETDPYWTANFSLYNSSWSLDTNTLYYNSTGLGLNGSNYFDISLGYRMPQGCNDGEIAEYNTTSGGWDCAIDNSAASGMASWVLASSDTGGSESITDGETVTFSDDNKYLNATRATNIITYSINEIKLNETIDLRDDDTTYSHLSNFTDDLGNRGYTSLTNFTNNLGIGNWTLDKTNYFTSAQVLSFNYYNSTDFDIGDYYLNSNPFGYYNSTTLPSSTETDPYWTGNFTLYNSSWSSTYNSTYNTWAYNQTTPAINKILSFNYYNSTDFDIGDYYLNSNPFGFWNDTYATFNKTYADTVYLNLSGSNANQDINFAPYNFEAANATFTQKITFEFGDEIDNIVNTWIRVSGGFNVTKGANVGWDLNVSGNITTEEIHLENDPVNHRIYDNSSCVIIRGDTSAMYIC